MIFVYLDFILHLFGCCLFVFFFKQKTAYGMLISDWSSDVCSSDLERTVNRSTDPARQIGPRRLRQAKLPLHMGVGIDARDICALLLERGGPPRLHANARGPQRVAGDPGLVAGCCNPAIGRARPHIKERKGVV